MMNGVSFTRLLLVCLLLILTTTLPAASEPVGATFKPQREPERNGLPGRESARRVAVAWNDVDSGAGVLRAMGTLSPWEFETPSLQIPPDSVVRSAGGQVYVVSQAEDTVAVIDPDAWVISHVYSLAEGSEPLDIAVVSSSRAYVTRRTATHLSRLDLLTGAVADVVDLGIFADEDGVPDMGMMAVHEGRIFIQIRRLNPALPHGFAPPAYIAVVDATTEQLVDVDPATPGAQAIELEGTPPKYKMQVVPQTRRLFVSASGDFFDEGGIEMIDLDTLQSTGMPIRESDDMTGADLGSFVMVSPERGYLVCSTDWTISSHLQSFTLTDGVDPGPELYGSIGYRVPTMVHDPQTAALFFPEGGHVDKGVHVFDALTGTLLTTDPVPTTGPPTDLALICEGLIDCEDFNCVSDPACYAVPATSIWGLAVMGLLVIAGGTILCRHRAHRTAR